MGLGFLKFDIGSGFGLAIWIWIWIGLDIGIGSFQRSIIMVYRERLVAQIGLDWIGITWLGFGLGLTF